MVQLSCPHPITAKYAVRQVDDKRNQQGDPRSDQQGGFEKKEYSLCSITQLLIFALSASHLEARALNGFQMHTHKYVELIKAIKNPSVGSNAFGKSASKHSFNCFRQFAINQFGVVKMLYRVVL